MWVGSRELYTRRTVRVVHGERQGIAERVIHVRLRSEVHHGIDLLRLQHVREEIRGQNIALDELEVQVVLNGLEVVERRAVVELVEDDHLVAPVLLHQSNGHVRSDEASSSCDEDILRLVVAHGS